MLRSGICVVSLLADVTACDLGNWRVYKEKKASAEVMDVEQHRVAVDAEVMCDVSSLQYTLSPLSLPPLSSSQV